MMLGSVFNRYHASTNSESSKAPQARLRTFKIGKDSHPFSEFKGLGPPESDIGSPGDIHIDLTPGCHALYARYPDSWRLWPGPKDASTLLLHPMHSDRCLWCNETFGWYHRKNIRVNPSGSASELLSNALKHQVTLSEESKKRKRDALVQVHQPTQTQPFSTTNASSHSQNRALENRSPTDAPSLSHSTTPTMPGYLQSTPEIMTLSTHIPSTAPNMQNSEYCTESSIPAETDHTDHMFTYKDLTPRSERNRNLQERCTSPKRIDLREFAKKRKSVSSTHGVDARSILYQKNETQSFPQPGSISPLPYVINKPSIQDSAHATNLDTNSTLIVGKTFANSADLHISPANKPRLISKRFHDPAPPASANQELPYREEHLTVESLLEKPTLENPIDNGLDNSIVELRMRDPSDTIATYVRATNDKIRRLEAENARLRARLIRCQCKLSSCDIPSMVTNVDMPVVDSGALSCALDDHGNNSNQFGVNQSQREIVGNIPSGSQLHPSSHAHKELESSSAPRLSATPPSLSVAGTTLSETTPSAQAIPLLEPDNMDYRDIIDISQVENGVPSLGDCKTFESSVNSPPVKEEIADAKTLHAYPSPVPTSTSLRMREIHRSVLFAKAGSSLICRICLGTKSGGIETVDQTFKTTEDSPDLMQEHCEKEHPKECEALMNMRDDELLELVSMITPEY